MTRQLPFGFKFGTWAGDSGPQSTRRHFDLRKRGWRYVRLSVQRYSDPEWGTSYEVTLSQGRSS